MSPSLQFIATVAAVFFSENLVLSQAMGAGELVVLAQRRSRIALTCLCMVLCSTVAAFFSWLVLRHIPLAPLVPLTYLAVLALLYLLLAFLVELLSLPDFAGFLTVFRPVLFGSAPAGVMLLAARQAKLLPSLSLGLGGGLGFCFALFFALQAQRHFAESDVPLPFRALPLPRPMRRRFSSAAFFCHFVRFFRPEKQNYSLLSKACQGRRGLFPGLQKNFPSIKSPVNPKTMGFFPLFPPEKRKSRPCFSRPNPLE